MTKLMSNYQILKNYPVKTKSIKINLYRRRKNGFVVFRCSCPPTRCTVKWRPTEVAAADQIMKLLLCLPTIAQELIIYSMNWYNLLVSLRTVWTRSYVRNRTKITNSSQINPYWNPNIVREQSCTQRCGKNEELTHNRIFQNIRL